MLLRDFKMLVPMSTPKAVARTHSTSLRKSAEDHRCSKAKHTTESAKEALTAGRARGKSQGTQDALQHLQRLGDRWQSHALLHLPCSLTEGKTSLPQGGTSSPRWLLALLPRKWLKKCRVLQGLTKGLRTGGMPGMLPKRALGLMHVHHWMCAHRAEAGISVCSGLSFWAMQQTQSFLSLTYTAGGARAQVTGRTHGRGSSGVSPTFRETGANLKEQSEPLGRGCVHCCFLPAGSRWSHLPTCQHPATLVPSCICLFTQSTGRCGGRPHRCTTEVI